MIKEILRRELVATDVFKDSEWKNYSEKIKINFTAESTFVENMQKELFLKGIESFIGVKDSIGETISLQTAVKNTFGWSTEQLNDELERIEEEKLNDKFKLFYGRDEEADQDVSWR